MPTNSGPNWAMERLVEMGKIRFVGVSSFTVVEMRRAQAQLSQARIVSNQVRCSLVDRTAEQELLTYCEAHQISLLALVHWRPSRRRGR